MFEALSTPSTTHATAAPSNPNQKGGVLCGWAWSSNIGWISFNSDYATVCPASTPDQSQQQAPQSFKFDLFKQAFADTGCSGSNPQFCVSVDQYGNITGHAWSSNIGWIQFGGLSDYPGQGYDAVVDYSSGKVSGWARACAGTILGDCSSMNSRQDGWDGWIELSGASHTSPILNGSGGVTFNKTTGIFNGYAWGGPVVGWINFSPTIPSASVQPTPVTCNGCGPWTPPPVGISCSLTPSAQINLPNSDGSFTVTLGSYSAWGGIGHNSPSDYIFYYAIEDSQSGSTMTLHQLTSSTLTIPVDPDTYRIYMEASDLNGVTSGTPVLCGTAVVRTPTNTFSLLSGPKSGFAAKHAQGNPLPVKKGSSFYLQYVVDISQRYDSCIPQVIPGTAPSAGNWEWNIGDSNQTPPTIKAYNNVGQPKEYKEFESDTATKSVGTYKFRINCKSLSDPSHYLPITTETWIDLRNVGEKEI